MKNRLIFVLLAIFSSSILGVAEESNPVEYYEVPEGYTPIEACNGKEVLKFWEMFQERGALIGEKIILLKKDDGTVATTIRNWDNIYDLVLCETGRMDCYMNNEMVHGEGSYFLYKGNLQNDGHLCYVLVNNGSGSGKYDSVCGVWKIMDDRIEQLDMYEDLANSFFPGKDAHLFYGHHATPFLIEKGGEVFMRWIEEYFSEENNETELCGI